MVIGARFIVLFSQAPHCPSKNKSNGNRWLRLCVLKIFSPNIIILSFIIGVNLVPPLPTRSFFLSISISYVSVYTAKYYFKVAGKLFYVQNALRNCSIALRNNTDTTLTESVFLTTLSLLVFRNLPVLVS